jgi:hypothetical protein
MDLPANRNGWKCSHNSWRKCRSDMGVYFVGRSGINQNERYERDLDTGRFSDNSTPGIDFNNCRMVRSIICRPRRDRR